MMAEARQIFLGTHTFEMPDDSVIPVGSTIRLDLSEGNAYCNEKYIGKFTQKDDGIIIHFEGYTE